MTVGHVTPCRADPATQRRTTRVPQRRLLAISWLIALLHAGCHSSHPQSESIHAEESTSSEHHDEAWVTKTCTREYQHIEENWATYMPREKATSPFAHCRHWRMAAPEACGARVQPSFMDPCHCMCDLCDTDADCESGASCVTLSSTICGSEQERVCVRKTDACHPDNAKSKCATRCVTLFGHPECVSQKDIKLCGR